MLKVLVLIFVVLLISCSDSSTNSESGSRRLSEVISTDGYIFNLEYNDDKLVQLRYKNGNDSTSLPFIYEGGLVTEMFGSRFTYNQEGNAVKMSSTYDIILYDYFDDGKLKSKKGVGEYQNHKVYTYNEDGSFNTIIDSTENDKSYDSIHTREYVYSDQGELIMVHGGIDNNKSIEYTEMYSYENGLLVSCSLSGGTIEYSYNSEGLVISKKEYLNATLTNETYYDYDDGLISEKVIKNGEGIKTINYFYEYGESNNEEIFHLMKFDHSWDKIEDSIFPENQFYGSIF